MTQIGNPPMTAVSDEACARTLQILDRWNRASRARLRYRFLRHPILIGYPTPARLQKWKRLGFSTQAKARTPWGQRIVVTLPDDVSVALRRNGFFEYELSAFYLRLLKAGMTFFDVGAHVGYFSMLAGRAVGETGRVYAFEPTPSTYRVLALNARAEPNITPVNRAVWSDETEIQLRDYGPCFSAFNSSFTARLPESVRRGLVERRHTVRAVSLDTFAREQGCVPDVVKIDVESAESYVLRGMRTLLTEARPVVSLEVGDMGVDGAVDSRDLIEQVLAYDYRAFELRGGRALPHQLRRTYGYENIVLAPAEAADRL